MLVAAKKTQRTEPSNPVDSPWYSTPRAARHRKSLQVTLPPEALEALEQIADDRGVSRSVVLEALIMREGGKVQRR